MAQLYRHHDGYPSSIIPSLARLYKTQYSTGMERGAHYTAANYIFFEKLNSMRFAMPNMEVPRIDGYDRDEWDDLTAREQFEHINSRIKQDFEFENNDPNYIPARFPVELLDHDTHRNAGRATYLLSYGVENPADGIHGDEEWIYEINTEMGWTVKVSSDFGRRSDSNVDPWKRATWEFKGPLTDAVEEYAEVGWDEL
jgi:hypothetical protein